MFRWFTRLICKHEYEFNQNIYGDAINYFDGKRSIWVCKHCGKCQFREDLGPFSQGYGYRNSASSNKKEPYI